MSSNELVFDVYGRMRVQAARENCVWVLYWLSERGKVRLYDIALPADLAADIATFLDEMFHECAKPGQAIRRL